MRNDFDILADHRVGEIDPAATSIFVHHGRTHGHRRRRGGISCGGISRGAISATVRHRPATEQSKQKTKNKQFGGLEDPWWHQIHSQQTGWSQKTKESIPAGFIGICLGVWMFSTRVWILLVIGPFTVQTTHAFVALVVPSLHPLVDPIRHRYPHVTCISMFNRLACIVGAFVFGTNLHPRTKSPTAQFLALSFGRVVAG